METQELLDQIREWQQTKKASPEFLKRIENVPKADQEEAVALMEKSVVQHMKTVKHLNRFK